MVDMVKLAGSILMPKKLKNKSKMRELLLTLRCEIGNRNLVGCDKIQLCEEALDYAIKCIDIVEKKKD